MKLRYTDAELAELLRQKRGHLSLKEHAAEIGCSYQLLSDIDRGSRSVVNEKILGYLAPEGRKFEHREFWELVEKK